jgi:HTH-type transcriptional regulator/antitoxin HigA
MRNDHKTPGQLIEYLLDERGWNQRLLSSVLQLGESTTNKLISGKQAVTADMALILEEVFNVPADTFLTLQKDYELARARLVARPDPRRAARAELFKGLPVGEMMKRGWLNQTDIRDVSAVERELSTFFNVDSVDEIEFLPHAAKKTAVHEATTPVQLAWLYRVKSIAQEMIVAPFSELSARRVVTLLKALTVSRDSLRKVSRLLAEAGIRFVIVESLPSAKIDGVCLWLDDSSPVIALSFRHDRIDNFWFVLRHELEHIIRGHGKDIINIDDLDGARAGSGDDIPEEERQANDAAAEFCVPAKTLAAFIARKDPFFADVDIRSLATALNIHPGLVAGQLQHKTGLYNRFREHLVKVRTVVSPGAAVDGWGDVFPVGH